MVVSHLFEKLRYSNITSTKFEFLPRIKVLRGGNGQMVALKISSEIESLYGLCRQATKLWLWNIARLSFGQFSVENS